MSKKSIRIRRIDTHVGIEYQRQGKRGWILITAEEFYKLLEDKDQSKKILAREEDLQCETYN